MKLPIRNYTDKPLGLLVEPMCDQYEVPSGGEAVVVLVDGFPHSIDVHEDLVAVWNEGPEPVAVTVSATRVSVSRR